MSSKQPPAPQTDCKKRVRLNALRPGDVILSTGKSLDSRAIVAATHYGSPHRIFSHAAIALTDNIWFESNDVGVHPFMMPIAKVEEHGNERWRLADICESSEFAVFRHPSLPANLDPRWLFDTLEKITAPYGGMQYPSLSELKNATKLLSGFPAFKARLLAMIDWYQSKGEEIIYPGPFCSELVSLIYEQLAADTKLPLSLFRQPRAPSFTSPNDLGDPALSQLQQISGVVVSEDPTVADFNSPSFDLFRTGSQRVQDFNLVGVQQVEFMKSSKHLSLSHDNFLRTLRKLA